jgi:hypothetical protein
MSGAPLHRVLAGPFHFFRPVEEELRQLFPEGLDVLPRPQRIFLADERSTPIVGFPVLVNDRSRELEAATVAYVEAEEQLGVAMERRRANDSRAYAAAWDAYRQLVAGALRNVLTASYGRDQPGLFWLHHSTTISRVFRDSPRRLLRLDATIARQGGESFRLAILEKVLDRLLAMTYDVAQKLSGESGESEGQLFPRLLQRMRDNLFIFSETHVSRSLEEVGGYVQARLGLDPRELGRRLDALRGWHEDQFHRSAELQALAPVFGIDREAGGSEMLKISGYVRALAARPGYDAERFLSGSWLDIWEAVLLRLKEFEVFHALRRLVVPVENAAGGLAAVGRRSLLQPGQPLLLSNATRPYDFQSPWVVAPDIQRCGLIYDLADFSETLSRLRWSGAEAQDDAFRAFVRFQRKLGRLAQKSGLKLEKYLGDGAFFSSRDAVRVLIGAIRFQEVYTEALRWGLPFDKGVRMAAGFGSYRFVPIPDDEGTGDRYEFFGQGLVELSRLTSGKASREIDEVRMHLLNLGYPEDTVHRFFAPVLAERLEVVDLEEEKRDFYAYLNRNGTLVNEGIVATAKLVERLSDEVAGRPLSFETFGDRVYVATELEDSLGTVRVGLRKLGVANLKGLDRTTVYEVVPCPPDPDRRSTSPGRSLIQLLDENFTRGMGSFGGLGQAKKQTWFGDDGK